MAKTRGYGQACPVSKAAEIVAERWTPVVLRELLYGSRRFNEIRRGIPLITAAMLSRRLKELTDAGVVSRSGSTYSLTPCGEELRPIIEQLGVWGQRWALRTIAEDDLDARFVMWAAHRHLAIRALPSKRCVLFFELFDAPVRQRRWWIVVDDGHVDLCLANPGYEPDVRIETDVRTLTSVYFGHVEVLAALRARRLVVSGERALVRTFAKWCPRSRFADVARPGVSSPPSGATRR